MIRTVRCGLTAAACFAAELLPLSPRRWRVRGAGLPFRARPRPSTLGIPDCRTASDATLLAGAPRKLKLSRNAGAVCLAPCRSRSITAFEAHLDVELVNYSGSTDQREAPPPENDADGAGVAVARRRAGLDVTAAGTHGGRRVLAGYPGVDRSPISGKVVAVGDLAGPDKNFFSIQLAKQGIDPNKDVDWRAYPGNLLQIAVEKGEAQAVLAADPIAYLWLKDSAYKEVASNLDGDYRDTSCCIVGLRGTLVREEPQVARALTQALLDAAMFTAQNPEQAAASFQPYAPKTASLEDLQGMVRYHTHHHIRSARC